MILNWSGFTLGAGLAFAGSFGEEAPVTVVFLFRGWLEAIYLNWLS
jgi:hypothetical protein